MFITTSFQLVFNIIFIAIVQLLLVLAAVIYFSAKFSSEQALTLSERFLANVFSRGSGYYFLLICIFSALCMFIPYAFLNMRNRKKFNTKISFAAPKPELLILAVLIGLLISTISSYVTNIFMILLRSINAAPHDIMPDLPGNLLDNISFSVYVGILAPIFEEFAFRGVVLSQAKKISGSFGILISAGLFSLMHVNVPQMIPAFALGLLMAYFVLRFDSIWYGIAIHFSVNALSLLEQQLLITLNAPVFAVINMLFLFFIVAFGIISLVLFLTKYKFGSLKSNPAYSLKTQFVTLFKMPSFYILLLLGLIMTGVNYVGLL